MDSDLLVSSLWLLGLVLVFWGIALRMGRCPERLGFWFCGSILGCAVLPALTYWGIVLALSFENPENGGSRSLVKSTKEHVKTKENPKPLIPSSGYVADSKLTERAFKG